MNNERSGLRIKKGEAFRVKSPRGEHLAAGEGVAISWALSEATYYARDGREASVQVFAPDETAIFNVLSVGDGTITVEEVKE
jgi:hypothetical protein